MKPMSDERPERVPPSTARRLISCGIAVMVGAVIWFSVSAEVRSSDVEANDYLRDVYDEVGFRDDLKDPSQVDPLPFVLAGGVGALMVLSGVTIQANDRGDEREVE